MKKGYFVGYNMPGYMPDNEPEYCESLEDAKECLLTDLTHYREDLNLDHDQEHVDQLTHLINEIEKAPAQVCNVYIANYVFWINEE